MPMPNQTIIAVPTTFKDVTEVRVFLVKLITELDIALGYRNSPDLEAVSSAPLTVSGAYSQSEIEAIAMRLETVVARTNVLIARANGEH